HEARAVEYVGGVVAGWHTDRLLILEWQQGNPVRDQRRRLERPGDVNRPMHNLRQPSKLEAGEHTNAVASYCPGRPHHAMPPRHTCWLVQLCVLCPSPRVQIKNPGRSLIGV